MSSTNRPLFSPRMLLRDLLCNHQKGDFQNFFCMGGQYTTPHLSTIDARWQFPWRSTLLILVMFLFFLLFTTCEHVARLSMNNVKLYLGSVFIGTIIVPIGMVTVLAEMNLWRNISWLRIVGMMTIGGLISIVMALLLSMLDLSGNSFNSGFIEEPAKIATALIIAGHKYRNGRILNGILTGAAVGAGFAIFETAGYTFEELLHVGHTRFELTEPDLNYQGSLLTLAIRSIFSLTAGHVTWTAITCGALWLGMQGRSLGRALCSPIFICFLLGSATIHGFWNLSAESSKLLTQLPLYALLSWGLLAILISMGISQIRSNQQYWHEYMSENEAGFYLLNDKGEVLGPYTAKSLQELYPELPPKQKCISACCAIPSPVSQLSFLRSEKVLQESLWYDCPRPRLFHIATALGVTAFISSLLMLLYPIISMRIYFTSSALLTFILLFVLGRAWRLTPTLNLKDNTQGIWAYWLHYGVPLYQFWWGYKLCNRIVVRYNIRQHGGESIPTWVPKLFWLTLCTGMGIMLAMFFFDAYSMLPYLIIIFNFYPVAALLMALAIARINRQLRAEAAAKRAH